MNTCLWMDVFFWQHTSGENQKSDENRVLGDTQEQVTKDLDTIKSSNNKQPPARQRHQDKPPPSNTLYEHITQDQTEVRYGGTLTISRLIILSQQQKQPVLSVNQSKVLERPSI